MRKHWRNPATKARCDGEHAFRLPESAERVAALQSRKTGDLIVAYKCPDCGYSHIGHADPSQFVARLPGRTPVCLHCGVNEIPPYLYVKAAIYEQTLQYCSDECRLAADQATSVPNKDKGGQPGAAVLPVEAKYACRECGAL